MRPLQLKAGFSPAAILTLMLASVPGLPATAGAQNALEQIVVFGDSLSDPGNGFVFVRSNSTPPDYGMGPLLIPNAPYARGGHHLSNGATWIEQLARPLGLARSVAPAFRGSNPHSMNFAIGTARARDDGTNPSLAMQVAAFLQKSGGVAAPDALYVIQIGGNDIRDALATGDQLQGLAILQAAVASIADAVSLLYAAGARNFLIWNAPDVSFTPAVRMLGPDAMLAGSLATNLFNAALVAALTPLTGLPGINIVPFDAAGLFAEMISSPSPFGLANVTDACVMPNDPPFACSNPDGYLFWDGVHPTAAVHAIIAEAVAALLGL